MAPLAVVPLAELDFGWVETSGHGNGTATIQPYGTVVDFAGSAGPGCRAGGSCEPPHAARFAVTGEAGRSYVVRLPTAVTIRGAGLSAPLLVTRLVVRTREDAGASASGRLDGRGRGEFAVGGTLIVAPLTPPGRYRTTLPVIVTYS